MIDKDTNPIAAGINANPNGHTTEPTTWPDAIVQMCGLLLEPGSVAELRALKTARGTVSGYFTDWARLAEAAIAWNTTDSIYVTMNPVGSALLGRADNHVVPYATTTTADDDIVQRRWILVDVDPARPRGIASTDAEHAAALALGHTLLTWLREQGITSVILADSGNGAHLLIRVDLPNNASSTALVKRFLAALAARFSTDQVLVDRVPFNAARLMRVYPSWNRKGDPLADRPHRVAALLHVPDVLPVTPPALLEAIAPGPGRTSTSGPTPPPSSHHRKADPVGRGVDVLAAVEAAGLYRTALAPPKHGIYCPWQSEHSGDSGVSEAVLFEPTSTDEAWAFKCMHLHCADRTITDVLVVLGLNVPQFPPLLPDAAMEPLFADQADDPDAVLLTEARLAAKLSRLTYDDLRRGITLSDAWVANLYVRLWGDDVRVAAQEPWARWWNGTTWQEDSARGRMWQRGFLTLRLLERAPWTVPIPDVVLSTRRQQLAAMDQLRMGSDRTAASQATKDLAGQVRTLLEAGALFRLPESRALTAAELGQLSELSARVSIIPRVEQYYDRKELEAVLRTASDQPPVRIDVTQIDTDPWLLACQNGYLNLKTFTLQSADPRALITRAVAAAYDKNARCPRWLTFLDEIFDKDGDLVAFIQRSLGYALTGDTTEQVFWILYGLGSNGKSTLLRVFSTLLVGHLPGRYGAHTRADTIMVKRNEVIPADVAALHRARWVSAAEAGRARQLDEELIKSLTGEDAIPARFLHKNYFTFIPQFKLWLAVNHKPRIKGTDPAIWRRPLLVPFLKTFRGTDDDKGLRGKLLAELPGILAWCVEGERDRQEHGGLRPPSSVLAATRQYRREEDRLTDWLRDRCVPAPGIETSFAHLSASYLSWTEGAREKPLSLNKAFPDALTERGFASKHTGVERVRLGLRLRVEGDKPDAVLAAWAAWEAARDGVKVEGTP